MHPQLTHILAVERSAELRRAAAGLAALASPTPPPPPVLLADLDGIALLRARTRQLHTRSAT